jgi:hypothetical protein
MGKGTVVRPNLLISLLLLAATFDAEAEGSDISSLVTLYAEYDGSSGSPQSQGWSTEVVSDSDLQLLTEIGEDGEEIEFLRVIDESTAGGSFSFAFYDLSQIQVAVTDDAFPLDKDESVDSDGVGVGNNEDSDDDVDRLLDEAEAFPTISLDGRTDADADGLPDECDVSCEDLGMAAGADDDNDGVTDSEDAFPSDSRFVRDTDSDGMPDAWEEAFDLNKEQKSDADLDLDGDGLTNISEFLSGTNPSLSDSDHDTLPDGWELQNSRDPVVPDYQLQMSAGFARNFACARSDDGIVCWGSTYFSEDWSAFQFGPDCCPSQAGGVYLFASDQIERLGNVNYDQGAAIVDGDIFLWGRVNNGVLVDRPVERAPKLVATSDQGSCWFDDDGIGCWGHQGSRNMRDVPSMEHVTQLVMGRIGCALGFNELKCWGQPWNPGFDDDLDGTPNWQDEDYVSPNDNLYDLPPMSNPTFVDLFQNSSSGCAIDDGAVTCWPDEEQYSGVPAGTSISPRDFHSGENSKKDSSHIEFQSVTYIALGYQHSCVIESGSVKCWGRNDVGQSDPPELVNPSQVDVSVVNSCALTDRGIICWGAPLNQEGIAPLLSIDPDGDGYSSHGGADSFHIDASEYADSDGDGVGDNTDLFPADPSESMDTDLDGIGNQEDADDDGDGVADSDDAFPLDLNESVDTDSDGIGNNEDTDDDSDGVADSEDAFPLDATEFKDTDDDGVGDNSDAFPDDASESKDTDLDEVGDNADNCPILANTDQVNTDGDLEGDACDLDDDNDGFSDEEELADGTNPLSRFSCRSGCFSFDIDENKEAKALSDGLLVIRHLFGFSGDSLTSGATTAEGARTSAEAISSYLSDADSELDIDGDGQSKALTDGLLLIRYLFGFSGDSLTAGAIGEEAERTTAEEIQAYIGDRVPSQ